MGSVGLLYVGAVLFLNGVMLLGWIDAKSAAPLNVFVGIPGSMLYKNLVQNKTFEYQDDLGLIYLPGYDIKTKYFKKINIIKL